MVRTLLSAVDGFFAGRCLIIDEGVEEISDESAEVQSVLGVFRPVRIS